MKDTKYRGGYLMTSNVGLQQGMICAYITELRFPLIKS